MKVDFITSVHLRDDSEVDFIGSRRLCSALSLKFIKVMRERRERIKFNQSGEGLPDPGEARSEQSEPSNEFRNESRR